MQGAQTDAEKKAKESLGVHSVHPMVFHSELQPEAQATTSPGTRNTGESRALGTCFAVLEEDGGALEAKVGTKHLNILETKLISS